VKRLVLLVAALLGARIQLTVEMLGMNMGSFTLPLAERSAGTYTRAFPSSGWAAAGSSR